MELTDITTAITKGLEDFASLSSNRDQADMMSISGQGDDDVFGNGDILSYRPASETSLSKRQRSSRSLLTRYEEAIIEGAKKQNSFLEAAAEASSCSREETPIARPIHIRHVPVPTKQIRDQHLSSIFDMAHINQLLRDQRKRQDELVVKIARLQVKSALSQREQMLEERFGNCGTPQRRAYMFPTVSVTPSLDDSDDDDSGKKPRKAVHTAVKQLEVPTYCPRYLSQHGLRSTRTRMENIEKIKMRKWDSENDLERQALGFGRFKNRASKKRHPKVKSKQKCQASVTFANIRPFSRDAKRPDNSREQPRPFDYGRRPPDSREGGVRTSSQDRSRDESYRPVHSRERTRPSNSREGVGSLRFQEIDMY